MLSFARVRLLGELTRSSGGAQYWASTRRPWIFPFNEEKEEEGDEEEYFNEEENCLAARDLACMISSALDLSSSAPEEGQIQMRS